MLAIIGILVYLVAVSAAVTRASGQPRERTVTEGGRGAGPAPSVTVPLIHGHSGGYWHWRLQQTRRELARAQRANRRLRRTLIARPSVTEAINLAGATYGHTDTLWRKARCESGLNPNARNGSEASGLLQLLPSTWATTPYARFSIWSPYANAMAAGWMHAHGRGDEWSCR